MCQAGACLGSSVFVLLNLHLREMSWEPGISSTSSTVSTAAALFHKTWLNQSLSFFSNSFYNFFLFYLSQNVCEGPFKFKENEVRHFFFGAESNSRPSRGALMTEQQNKKKTLFPHRKRELLPEVHTLMTV